MKYLLLSLAISACTLPALAQEQSTVPDAAPERKNEAGIFLQTDFGGSDNYSFTMMGAQYNHWITPHLGFRIIGAYGNYDKSYAVGTTAPHPDTIITKNQIMSFNMPVLGFGLTAQRHFYKRIHLYAALELNGAYGKGRSDTLVRTIYPQGSATGADEYEVRSGNRDATNLMINLTASVGAKLQFSRVAFGVELMPVKLGYQQIKINGTGNGSADFNLGDFSQRLFFSYRF